MGDHFILRIKENILRIGALRLHQRNILSSKITCFNKLNIYLYFHFNKEN